MMSNVKLHDTATSSSLRATSRRKLQAVFLFLVMFGLFRSVGHFSIYLGYIAGLAGLFWIMRQGRATKVFLPTYLLVLWSVLSAGVNGAAILSYFQILLILGGAGIAEIVSRSNPRDIAASISRFWIIPIIIVTGIELSFFAFDIGQRTREVDETLTGGLLSNLNLTLPRLMGSMGGSAYSATMLGALAWLCWVEKQKTAAMLLFAISFLMISRGPMLALIIATAYHAFSGWKIAKLAARFLVIFCISFPIFIWWLEGVLSSDQQLFLIQISSSRFLHYLSFLNFGIENPVFGVGYSNWREAYQEYFWSNSFQSLRSTSNENLIREAHNLILDVFGELGFLGWLLISLQIVIVGRVALRRGARYGAMFIYVTVCFLFLSGLSSWTFWFVNGIVLSEHRKHSST